MINNLTLPYMDVATDSNKYRQGLTITNVEVK